MMRALITENALGVIAFSEEGEMIDYELCLNSVEDAVEHVMSLQAGKPSIFMNKLLERLKEKGITEIAVEDQEILNELKNMGFNAVLLTNSETYKTLRAKIMSKLEELSKTSKKDLYNQLREIILEVTRRTIRTAAQKRDLQAIQAVRFIDDIDKTINLFSERLREWYSLHFPELDKAVEDHKTYSILVAELGERGNFTEENLKSLGFQEDRAKKIASLARKSIGPSLTDVDLKSIQKVAEAILYLYSLRQNITDYLDSVMREVAPNLMSLAGSTLSARFLSKAGSLEALAKMPASTIQVLGAEKALFRSLRSGARPPKHGIIFQYQDIFRAPRWQRGKIARALAAKLAIAAKVDAYSGRLIADTLKHQIEQRIKEIKEKYQNPPPRKEEVRKREAKRGKKNRR